MNSQSGFFIMSVCALITNSGTLGYIVRSYDVTVHVFSLLVMDATISTAFAALSFVLDILVLSGSLTTGTMLKTLLCLRFAYCSWSFAAVYLPSHAGAILTFLISLLRYGLAVKAAKNIQPSNRKVLKNSILAFTFLYCLICGYMAINELLDVPYSLVIEGSAWHLREPRVISTPRVLILQSANYYNVASLLIDLLMLRFLKQKIKPTVNVRFIQMRGNLWSVNEENVVDQVHVASTQSSVKEIPVRATIFSGLCVVPYVLVLTAIFGFNLGPML